jgi:hypothetical protein
MVYDSGPRGSVVFLGRKKWVIYYEKNEDVVQDFCVLSDVQDANMHYVILTTSDCGCQYVYNN